jgi:2-iminobutanoate/2-iminopropanoate deaminase
VAGRLVFVSGQLPLDREGRLVGDDIAAQARQVIGNLKAVLAEAGSSIENVVKATVWLTDARHFREFNAVYAETFGTHPPARSLVISGLAVAGALVEIEAVAMLPE